MAPRPALVIITWLSLLTDYGATWVSLPEPNFIPHHTALSWPSTFTFTTSHPSLRRPLPLPLPSFPSYPESRKRYLYHPPLILVPHHYHTYLITPIRHPSQRKQIQVVPPLPPMIPSLTSPVPRHSPACASAAAQPPSTLRRSSRQCRPPAHLQGYIVYYYGAFILFQYY